MSVDQRKTAWDAVKMIVGISLAISSFLIADTYREQKDASHQIIEQLHNIETRVIRIEYELKLK